MHSLVEQATREKWIDGKIIYKKTISLGNMPSSGSKNVAHGITGLDLVINIVGNVNDPSVGQYTLPMNSAASGAALAGIRADNTYVTVAVSSNLSAYTGYATLWYTKT